VVDHKHTGMHIAITHGGCDLHLDVVHHEGTPAERKDAYFSAGLERGVRIPVLGTVEFVLGTVLVAEKANGEVLTIAAHAKWGCYTGERRFWCSCVSSTRACRCSGLAMSRWSPSSTRHSSLVMAASCATRPL
jgi:hypothetical protein